MPNWRLPTIHELKYFTEPIPAGVMVKDPFMNFNNVKTIWSSSPHALSGAIYIISVNGFMNGRVALLDRNKTSSIWPVKELGREDNEILAHRDNERFVKLGNYKIYDRITKLVWLEDPTLLGKETFDNAMLFAPSMDYILENIINNDTDRGVANIVTIPMPIRRKQ